MSADLALAADASIVERAADPGEFIIQACERAKTWLATVLEHGDIDQIVECKSQAEAIRVYTMSKQLGKDAQISATEIVRRAERGIGVCIRRGQKSGGIRRQGQSRVKASNQRGDNTLVASPTDFASHDELGGNNAGIYHMTDGVTDDDFEQALDDARAEGNLGRANVVRKLRNKADREWIPAAADRTTDAVLRRRELIGAWAARGYSSRQMSEQLGTADGTIRAIARECGIDIPADKIVGKTRRHDSNRIVRETVSALEGLAMGAGLVDPDDLDQAEIANWAASLTDSIRVLNRLVKTMREMAQ